MCRRNLFFAGILIAFGVGLLVGVCLESSFVRCLIGLGTIIGGFVLLKR